MPVEQQPGELGARLLGNLGLTNDVGMRSSACFKMDTICSTGKRLPLHGAPPALRLNCAKKLTLMSFQFS
jgi:hypothetical protein